MEDNKSFQQQVTKIKPPINEVKSRVRQIAAIIASVTGLLGISGVAAVGYYAFVPPPIKRLPLSQNLISLESSVGQKILSSTQIKQDYTPLITYLETQKRPAYCGVASGVTVLNALGKGESTYQRLDQESFFNGVAQSVRSPYLVTFFGMSLDELAALVQSHNRTVEIYHASSTTLEQFRTQAKANLKHDKDFIIVNYDRSQIGQTGGGHISPIAAYSEKMDKFLILDVSTYKYPPVWVSASTLWAAMNTSDVVTNKTRGYLIVKR
ncbi:hypothetical protein CDG76_20290 [Nostoc sp. 'Peltigera membranacea cyanobiont' 210A]|uniref:phytochelatin synthase family protein n=1 Tax=Nostoc sp. 'Peltigera membranacea cyanobiont' 210A TaxID=2014529 RepID=UPI000B9562E4|nr:phytochelatin synthase family protein [Nostoc sp. 'Peltigera membranacea cyanobiont' 210A]OYD93044.1 hypothetical protein CDG76_20290 [Nostoc sp. 'Peltigera membranacea cyanobiont' 210A]